MSDYILELKNISKNFSKVSVLNDINFQLKRGEVHALLGENGAGKSTLIKIISGALKPTSGKIYYHNKEVSFKSTIEAMNNGIIAIYQQMIGFLDLTVAENIFINHEIVKNGLIDWKMMNKKTDEILKFLNVSFSATDKLGDLSMPQQQVVAIAKALSVNTEVIIMDEPTASLSKKESLQIYEVVEKLKSDGKSIIYISHRLEDIYRLADRMTIIRDGKYVGTYNKNELTENELVKNMVGKNIDDLIPKFSDIKIGKEVLRVENLRKRYNFKNVNLYVREGEIVSIAGLVGSGRTRVCEAICGLKKYDTGKIFIDNKEVKIKSYKDAVRHGIGLIPDDRQIKGLILSWDISKNITLPNINKYSKFNFILSNNNEIKAAQEFADKVEVKADSIYSAVNSLSGGNQQKVVIAKAFSSDFKIIIMDDPTKGIDVGAKSTIYKLMGELVKRGAAIILLSSDIKELMGMSDRIYVMKDGKITGEISKNEFSQEKILELEINKNESK